VSISRQYLYGLLLFLMMISVYASEPRGMLGVGYAADLVLFDPETVTDHATIEASTELSSGIESVWVNGKLVFNRDDQLSRGTTSARPGEFLSR
jgi:N-acyl-D-aspartate/D-glutamate deacylase